MQDVLYLLVMFGLVIGFVYFLVWWSYKAREDRSAKAGLYIVLGGPAFLLLVAGAALIVNGRISPWGITMALTAIGLIAPISPKVRTLFARFGAFEPDDPLHMTGLGLFLGLFGFLAGQNILSRAPDQATEFAIGAIIVQGLFFVGLALAAIGIGIGRNGSQARVRLGLVRPTAKGLGMAMVVVASSFALALTTGILQAYVDADTSRMIDQNLETLTGGQSPLVMAPVIGITAGISEELLFRGVLQPRYGIVLTSLLFTSLHSQYGLSFVLLGLFGVSLIFGLLARRYGTTHAIIAHAVYNMVAVILSSL